MKKILLAGVCLFISCLGAVAQNKTLGVGVPTPNPNAALHVESPTGNQGFMMPRLTTAQREAMASLLSDTDKGLILYDTDLYSIFVWDGASWGSTSQFVVDDPASNLNAITVSSLGVGAAARFSINNPSSFAHAVHAESNGDSTSAAVHGNHLGNGFGVFGKSAGSKFASAAVYGEHVGIGDAAGAFRISNTANTYSALFGETNGSGPAIFGSQKGTGRGGQFQITNTANASAALRAYTSGTGNAGFFTINNASSTVPGIFTTTNGSGAAILAENNGTADGFAGMFTVTQSTNTFPAIQANSAGSGSGVRVMQDKGTGAGMDVFMKNGSSTAPGMSVDHSGLGNAAFFSVSNTASGAASIHAKTGGTGSAIEAVTASGFTALFARHEGAVNGNAALIEITNAANAYPALQANTAGTGYAINARHTGTSGDAIYAEHAGAASGSAGNFRISNPENGASALFGATNALNGTGMGASNDANGVAFAIWSGGLKIAVVDVTTSPIDKRASAYRITAAGTFTLGYIPTDGEVFMIYNESGQDVSFNASGITHPIVNGQGKTFIVFPGGAVRGF